jgi:hypothetical protein
MRRNYVHSGSREVRCVEPRSNRVSARQDFQRVFSVALRFLFKFTAVVREPVAPPYSLPINSAPVTYNTLLPVTISMSGQEDILDGLEVNLKRSIKFSFSSNLTPHRRSAYRATPKRSNHYLHSHPRKNTMDRK